MKLKLILVFILISCSHHKDAKINYHTKNIYDLDVYNGHIVYFCSEPTDPDSRSFFNIYLFRSTKVDSFFTRRKLGFSECKNWVKEIDNIYKNSKQLRIVGIEGTEKSYEDKEVALRIGVKESVTVSSMWFFSRIVTEKGCFGHFGNECNAGYSEKSRFINP